MTLIAANKSDLAPKRGPGRPGPRPTSRGDIVRFRVTAIERDAIETGAARVGLSVSKYLRVLGTGHNPPSRVDLEAMRQLLRLRGDLGRVGGLLKLWLTDRAGEGAAVADVSRILHDLGELRLDILDKLNTL